jgi:hypothetical protein
VWHLIILWTNTQNEPKLLTQVLTRKGENCSANVAARTAFGRDGQPAGKTPDSLGVERIGRPVASYKPRTNQTHRVDASHFQDNCYVRSTGSGRG